MHNNFHTCLSFGVCPTKLTMATRADRRAERADRDTKVFPVGLHSQLRPELRTQFLDAVEQMLPDVNQILVELHLLLNYHFIRCIEEGVPLPDTLDSVVFNRACQAVSAAQGNCSQTAWRADLQLAAFFDLYEQECRPEGYQPAHRHNWYHNVRPCCKLVEHLHCLESQPCFLQRLGLASPACCESPFTLDRNASATRRSSLWSVS